MTRKKKYILGGVLLAVLAGTAGAGAWFMGENILTYLPYFGKHDPAAEIHPDQHQGDAKHEEASATAGETATSPAEEHGDVKAEVTNDGLVEASESGAHADVDLVPAPNYQAPVSRSSALVSAIREMNILQTQMAKGNRDAPQALKSAMLRVPAIVAKIDPAKISAAEVQSIALYVLSGGNPSMIGRLLKSEMITAEQKALLTGAMSYATADTAKASTSLLPLDPKQFEITLSAQLSLAQAQTATDGAQSENIKRLAFAADVAPGTLIEEAAIRRIIPQLASAGDVNGFSYWTQRYLRRFPNSLYYQDFEVSFVSSTATMLKGKHDFTQTALSEIFLTAGEERAASIARQILIGAIREGSAVHCNFIKAAMESSVGLKSENLTSVAVLIRICNLTEGGVEELQALKAIDASALDKDVKVLLSKAIAMSTEIHRDSPLKDDGRFGPDLPLAVDEAYAPMFASVAQQMDASVAAIRRVNDDEADSNK